MFQEAITIAHIHDGTCHFADRFLFSDAYANGPRATFLRPGNLGVPPFYSPDGDAGTTKEKGVEVDSREIAVNALEGLYGDLGQDAALARGEGAAAGKLASLPLAELERSQWNS
jgi:U2-associated protein SR140